MDKDFWLVNVFKIRIMLVGNRGDKSGWDCLKFLVLEFKLVFSGVISFLDPLYKQLIQN